MATLTQKVDGGAQFDGLASTGLFSFAKYDNLKETERLVISRIAYHAIAGGTPGSEVYFMWTNPLDLNGFILAGRSLNADIQAPDSSGDYVVCGGVVPRNFGGVHWLLRCYTVAKDVDATMTIDYQPSPFPHASPSEAIT